MRRIIALIFAVTAIAVLALVYVLPEGGPSSSSSGPSVAAAAESPSAAEAVTTAERIYPTLAEQPASPADVHLPTVLRDSTVVATGRVGSSPEIDLALTGQGELCIASENTSTCADARVAATAGVFFAAIDCSSSHPSAKLTGIVPRDVTQIEAGGQTAKPDADGAVTVTVPGGKVDDIQLSNGHASQLLLTGTECGQKTQTVEAQPVP